MRITTRTHIAVAIATAGVATCPSALQLCQIAEDYRQLRTLARNRGDLLAYAAGLIQTNLNKT